jgi:hypothetical protein
VSTPKSIVDAQVQHLLSAVEHYRSTRCAKIREQARTKANALISKAHKAARSRMHDDNVSTRVATHHLLTSTEARLQTRKRLARQQSDEELLEASWIMLEESLHRQWQQAGTRKQWVDNLVDQAMARLVSPHWRIEHPVDWPEQERTALQIQLDDRLGHLPEMEANPEIRAGLRLCTEGTCVDGTADGLMHERTRIEALMLATIHKHGDANHG